MPRLSAFVLGLALILGISCTRTHGQSTAAERQSPAPDLILQGKVRGQQNHSYIDVPFQVPEGLERVTITFSYTEHEQRTTLDLGMRDSEGLRCWSGGNKSTLTVGRSDATPSCLPGKIPAGRWGVLIGVPNIRPNVIAHYTIQVFFTRSGLVADQPAILRPALRSGLGWYRGDLHMHTGHSDGQCPSQTGKMVPCPVFLTVEAAARRGLDFIAITDHNATSQYDNMRELQPYFDKLLLIPGREVTTFQAHLNLLGTTEFLDFRLGSAHVPTMNDLLLNARKMGALVSINHPRAPSGEECMGCGWTPESPVDMNLLGAMEAVNAGSEDPAHSGIPAWEEQLKLGHRLTAIGGSDNHRPLIALDKLGSVGSPTTVIYAANLSTADILDGVRAGHVFIDLESSTDRLLNLTATNGSTAAHMGDLVKAPNDSTLTFNVEVSGVTQGNVTLYQDGKPFVAKPLSVDQKTISTTWKSDGMRHWWRADVTNADGKLLLLGNPIYVNW